MRRLEGRREEDDSARVLRDSLERPINRVRRRHPDQEHRVDLSQAVIEALGHHEIPAHDVDVRGQTGGFRIASHRTNPGTHRPQLVDDVTPDVPRGAGDEYPMHG